MKLLLFVVTTALIVQLFPRRSGFNYSYSEGHPWNYDLLTAPYDFAVQKDAVRLAQQRRIAMQHYEPYMRRIKDVEKLKIMQLSKLLNDKETYDYLVYKLTDIYKQGVAPSLVIDTLTSNGTKRVKVLMKDNNAISIELHKLNTVRGAYTTILDGAPNENVRQRLEELNLSSLLSENLELDTILSAREQDDILHTVSQTEGMIQAGERIVDKGEIVTKKTEQILNSLKASYQNKENETETDGEGLSTSRMMTIGGEIIAVSGLMALLFVYLMFFRPNIFGKTKDVMFILLTVMLPILLATVVMKMGTTGKTVYIVPFAIVPIVIRSFFDSRTALFCHIISTLIISIIVTSPYEFVVLQITAGMSAVSCLKDLTMRSQLARAAIVVFIDYVGFYIALQLIQETNISRIDPMLIIYFGISSLLLLFAYGLIYIFEKVFAYLSPVSLVELSNVNTSLLLRFAEQAPGTFQHSLQVANLVTAAASRIGANPLLARVGALYHDIGKLQHPEFFTENQLSGINPLSELDPIDASKLIASHVTDGVTMAKAASLPEPIIDFIKTHHGDGRTKYFYNTYVNQHPGEPVPEGAFRYSGPKPQTKEQALLMMADAVEAASRSLVFPLSGNGNVDGEINEMSVKLDDLVENIVGKQLGDGMFNEADITFAEINEAKDVFKSKLKTIYHTRVSYPELRKT